MTRFDLLFYALALAAVCGAFAAALVGNLRRASLALLVTLAALAALSALLGATAVAVLQAVVALATVAAERRLQRSGSEHVASQTPHGVPSYEARSDGTRSHEASPDAASSHEAPSGNAPPNAAPAGDAPPHDAPPRRWRAALPVVAFFALCSRAVLMARWPLSVPARATPAAAVVFALPLASVGFPHALVAGLLVFSIGLFACTARRSAAGVWIGIATMSGAVVLPVVAALHFLRGAEEGRLLATLVVVLSALPPWIAALLARRSAGSCSAEPVASGVFAVVAAVAFALLAVAR